jgi:hypothetical protein
MRKAQHEGLKSNHGPKENKTNYLLSFQQGEFLRNCFFSYGHPQRFDIFFFHILVVMCCSSRIPQFKQFAYHYLSSLLFCFNVSRMKKKVFFGASQRFVVVDE